MHAYLHAWIAAEERKVRAQLLVRDTAMRVHDSAGVHHRELCVQEAALHGPPRSQQCSDRVGKALVGLREPHIAGRIAIWFGTHQTAMNSSHAGGHNLTATTKPRGHQQRANGVTSPNRITNISAHKPPAA